MNKTIGIIGIDYIISTQFVEKIIFKTKASTDQEHVKMNIVINNKLSNKDQLKDIINKLERINTNYLILTFNNQEIYNYLKENTNIPILNGTFDLNDNNFIEQIIKLVGKESI